ncbi:MAG: ion channel [Balneolaceae bacterium]|nr:ion channel [Balneolaceae bacterium]
MRSGFLRQLSLLITVFGIGSVGYHYLEAMNFFDGFCMTFIPITTIGFTELQNFSDAGRILTMGYSSWGLGLYRT